MRERLEEVRRVLGTARESSLRLVARLRALPIDFVDVLMVIAATFAIREMLWRGLWWLDAFDETLLLVNAQMLNDGRVLYRDFSANYPPGIFELMRPVLALELPGAWTMRLIGFLVRLATAFGAAWLVGKARGKRPCLATGTVVLMLQSRLGVTPYAYCIAVLLLLGTIALWPSAASPRWRSFASGSICGLSSFVRIDLFCYGIAALVAVEAVAWVLRRRSLLFETRKIAVDFGGALVVTSLLLWGPHIAAVGVSRLAHDLVLDVARLAMPARVLPIPKLHETLRVAALDTMLPAWMVDRVRLCLSLGFAAAAAGGFYVVRGLRTKDTLPAGLVTTALVTLFAVCTLPQALGRTDYHHVAYGVPLALAVLGAVLGPRPMRLLALIAVLPFVQERTRFIDGKTMTQLLTAREDWRFMPVDRKPLVELIQAQTTPAEPIFVGCASHARHVFVPLDVYYWAHRHGATRYMQFDPGLTTSAPVHQQMIGDMERTRPKLAIRYHHCVWDEPNASRVEGSPLFDEYLNSHYVPLQKLPNFDVLIRKELAGRALTPRDDKKLAPQKAPQQRNR